MTQRTKPGLDRCSTRAAAVGRTTPGHETAEIFQWPPLKQSSSAGLPNYLCHRWETIKMLTSLVYLKPPSKR
jgi:hypothetical protein